MYSLKLLKYAKVFDEFKVCVDGKVDEFKSKKKCYDFWIDNISNCFGICKNEHGSKFGDKGQLSYQIINSLLLNTMDIQDILKYEIGYINSLKTDVNAFRKHIKSRLDKSNTFLENLLAINDDFAKTELYKSIRDDIVESYIKNVHNGKVKIENTDLGTLLGNPIELLDHAMGKEIKKPLHNMMRG